MISQSVPHAETPTWSNPRNMLDSQPHIEIDEAKATRKVAIRKELAGTTSDAIPTY